MAKSADYKDKTDENIVQPLVHRDGTITPVLEPNEARGGVTHHNVRFVLGLSLAGVVALFAIAYFSFFGGAPSQTQIGQPAAPAATAAKP